MITPRESPTQALYRAALGPVQNEHHLRVFERFDSLGATVPSWNWAAALFTFNWLIYRRLWRIAALYAVLVAAVAAGVWGLAWGRLPDGVTLGLAAALAVVATAVPGLYGNAWLHGQLRMALVDAARQAPSMADAADVLRQRAPSLARLLVLCLVNLLLLAVAVGWAWRSEGRAMPASPLAAAPSAAPIETKDVADVPMAPQPAPAGTVTEAVTSPLLKQATAATAATAPADASPPSVVAPAAEPQQRPTTAAAPSSAAPSPAPAPQPPAALQPEPEPVAQSVSEPIAVPVPGALGRVAPDTFAARGAYGINVGLFANRDNAQRALVRIRQAGMPARSDTLQMERGARVRVRAGPFASRAQADQAAVRIKALGLDAQVFRQGASD